MAVGWLWLTPPEDPGRWETSAAEELARPPEAVEERELQPFAVRRASKTKLSHYRDADGVFHFVEEPSRPDAATVQANNTIEIDARLQR